MKPDFGVYAKAKLKNTDIFTFKNLKFDEILRIEAELFSFFTTIEYNNTTFAVSFDFSADTLTEIFDKINNRYTPLEYLALLSKLLDPKMREREIKLKGFQIELSFTATLGPTFENKNESYNPFFIEQLIEINTINTYYV